MNFLHQTKFSLLQVIIAFFAMLILATGGFMIKAYLFTPSSTASVKAQRTHATVTLADLPREDTSALKDLLVTIDTLSQAPELRHGNFGFSLVTLDSSIIISEYNSQRSLVPASVVKTITTGVILARLGPDYRYETRLQYDGEIDANKVLHGNIYIKGSGDPSLGSDMFENTSVKSVISSWCTAIRALGIDSIDGAIIGDGEYFEHDMIPGGWAWEDMQSSYGIGTSGLAFRENTYTINITCKGNDAVVTTAPPVPGIKLTNDVLFNPDIQKNYLFVTGAPYQNERILIGQVKSNYSEQSNVPDPALFCAYNLMLALKSNKISVRDSCSTEYKMKQKIDYTKTKRTTFHTTYSPPLSKLVSYTNKASQNFYAETFLKTLGGIRNNFGTTAGGINAVHQYFNEKNVDMTGFYMVDGSGVSRFNALSAKFLTDMLVTYVADTSIFNTFYHSLSVAGESGTLHKMALDTKAAGNIHAKSGYMTRVRSYAGYVTTKSGKMLAFAMIMNNPGWDNQQTRDIMEKLMVLMAELE